MELFRDLWEWVVAVLEHWHGYVSGGVIAFALEFGEKLWEWKPPKKWIAIILIVGFIASIFSAWRDQYRLRQAAEKRIEELTKPNIKAEVVEFNTAPMRGESKRIYPSAKDGTALVTIIVRVTSLAMPSIAEAWTLSIKLPDGQVRIGSPLQLPKIITLRGDDESMQKQIFADDALYDKTTKMPMATGSVLYGALLYHIDAPYQEVAHGLLSLRWTDVTGKQSFWESPGKSLPMTPHTYPGMRRY